ncbi:MAG: hypothetical protein AAF417_06270 [Pseudomonadota bacterium]
MAVAFFLLAGLAAFLAAFFLDGAFLLTGFFATRFLDTFRAAFLAASFFLTGFFLAAFFLETFFFVTFFLATFFLETFFLVAFFLATFFRAGAFLRATFFFVTLRFVAFFAGLRFAADALARVLVLAFVRRLVADFLAGIPRSCALRKGRHYTCPDRTWKGKKFWICTDNSAAEKGAGSGLRRVGRAICLHFTTIVLWQELHYTSPIKQVVWANLFNATQQDQACRLQIVRRPHHHSLPQ